MTPLLLGLLLLAPPALPTGRPGDGEQAELADPETWIARGRELLGAGRAAEAQGEFEKAYGSTGTLRSRMWLLRSWMDQGRINDALDATDELKNAGERGVEIDYLYGMAWFTAAEKKIETDSHGPSMRRNVLDAVTHLMLATDTDDESFGDALYPLAKMAWMSQRLEVARNAAGRATIHDAGDARAHHLLGRVALSQAEIEGASRVGEDTALAHEETALTSLERAVVLLGTPRDRAEEALLAETHLQLLRLHLRRRSSADAAEALAGAIAWDPERVDFEGLYLELPAESFTSALAAGASSFEKHFGKEQRIGVVYWWLGYSRFREGLYAAAERSFLASLATQRPGTRSAWYYVARLRYVQGNHGGAVAAVRAFWDVDPAELLATLESDATFTGSMLDDLGAWCAREGRLVDTTIVYELAAEVVRTSAAWQQLGRYLAEQAKIHIDREGPGSPTGARCNATALQAFDRADKTSPQSPEHMLDLAVHLHMVLGADLERARDLYERSRLVAGQQLADPGLDIRARSRLTEIRRTARENLGRLEREER